MKIFFKFILMVQGVTRIRNKDDQERNVIPEQEIFNSCSLSTLVLHREHR